MRYILLIILSLFFVRSGFSQFHFTSMGGAHFNGLGRAGMSVEGISAIYNNPAGLSSINKWMVDVSYERRFNLEDLSSIQVSAAKNFNFGTIGFVFSQFGTEVYNEQLYGLAYGRKLNNSVSIGGMLSVVGFYFQQTGSKVTGTFSIGGTVKINHQFKVSTRIFSPAIVSISENSEIATRAGLGLTYSPSQKVALFSELDKSLSRPQWEYKFGISYQIIDPLAMQIGFNPSAQFYAFGISYRVFQKCFVKTAGSVHQVLGITPALSISYGE
ncbi:MAG: hypothetical protein WAT79_00325 [Saprospiraceae bacterium]